MGEDEGHLGRVGYSAGASYKCALAVCYWFGFKYLDSFGYAESWRSSYSRSAVIFVRVGIKECCRGCGRRIVGFLRSIADDLTYRVVCQFLIVPFRGQLQNALQAIKYADGVSRPFHTVNGDVDTEDGAEEVGVCAECTYVPRKELKLGRRCRWVRGWQGY